MVEAFQAGSQAAPSTLHMVYTCGGMMLYKFEWEGVWQRFECAIPDIDALLGRK
jgi:hypothetical protein